MPFDSIILLALITISWWLIGVAVARYIFQQHEWLILIPGGMGLGIVIHAAALNITARLVDFPAASWLSLSILWIIAGGLHLYFHPRSRPMEAGLIGKKWHWVIAIILFLMLWGIMIRVIILHPHSDEPHHYATSALIANGGLPIRSYMNPDRCTTYHFGSSLLAAALFRSTDLSLQTVLAHINIFAIFAVLGTSAALMIKINPRRSLAAGLLGAVLLLTVASAGWMYYPFKDSDFYARTEHIAAFEPLRDRINGAYPYSFLFSDTEMSAVFFTYVYTSHASTLNLGLFCALWVIYQLMSVPDFRSRLRWLGIGIVTGLCPFFFTTLYSVPLAMLGIFFLFACIPFLGKGNPTSYPLPMHGEGIQGRGLYAAKTILLTALLVFLPALILPFIQGGILTDKLFCHPTFDLQAQQSEAIHFPVSPGFYTVIDAEWLSLLDSDNWLRAFVEWGLIVFLYPVLIYHYGKRRHMPALALLIATLLIVMGLFFTDLGVNADQERIAVQSLWLVGMLAADWLVETWRRVHWQRILLILLFLGLCSDGLVLLYKFAYPKIHLVSVPLDPIDRLAQQEWFGELGERDDYVLYLANPGYPTHLYNHATVVLGNYSYNVRSIYPRSLFSDNAFITERRQLVDRYPHPALLDYLGFRYVYVTHKWWNAADPLALSWLQDPTMFEEVFTIRRGFEFRTAYRVIPPSDRDYPAGFSVLYDWKGENFAGVYGTWAAVHPSGEPVYFPTTPATYPISDFLPGVTTFDQLAPDQQAGMERWRGQPFPGDLAKLGFRYLLVDTGSWQDYSKYEIQLLLNNPNFYTLLHTWTVDPDREYRLYQVNGEVSADTLGLFPDMYAAFQAHPPAIILPADARLFYPYPADLLRREQLTLLNHLSYRPSDAAAFFDLLRLEQQAVPEQLDTWKEFVDPAILRDAGFDYVLISSFWWLGNLDAVRLDRLLHSSDYTIVAQWQFEATDQPFTHHYYLLRVSAPSIDTP